MSYFAMFLRSGQSVFRMDTRIYLADVPTAPDAGRCIAAVIGKNPGSARWRKLGAWGPLELGNDKMLPYVRNRFCEAYRRRGVRIPRYAFVRVWNLFYVCNEKLNLACREFENIDAPLHCKTEGHRPPITWFVWGGNDVRLNCHKTRFLTRRLRNPFYFDKDAGHIVRSLPTSTAFAKHTQGLPTDPIEAHLAELL
jgi:hypothetical protein